MKKNLFILLMLTFFNADAQNNLATGADAEIIQKVTGWVNELQLKDAKKEQAVREAISSHLKSVRDWHNSHSFDLVPAGINPVTGNKLSDMDRQIIVCSTKPQTIHSDLMTVLNRELSPEQVEAILDRYTIGKVAFTLKGYEAIVPDLTKNERAEILKNLEQAREQAIDYKNMKEISAIFEIYKTKCEQYLNNNGRSWRQLFKNYVDKVKAEKEKKKS